MTESIRFCVGLATQPEIAEHLRNCDASFLPPLSSRVKITGYAQKIFDNATRFEAWAGGVIVGLVAAYCNKVERRAYITNVSVLPEWRGSGIAMRLMEKCVDHVMALHFERIELEVERENARAVRLYEGIGFAFDDSEKTAMSMYLSDGTATRDRR